MPRTPKRPRPAALASLAKPAPVLEHQRPPDTDLEQLVGTLGSLIEQSRSRALAAVNTEMIELYWQLGRHIVEFEQGGQARATYGEALLPSLAARLTERFGRGFSEQNLRNCRQVYLAYPIRQALPGELSWTHLLTLLRVEHPLGRTFYEQQCRLERWSTRELERQINSMLFERIALSKDKAGVLALARDGQTLQAPGDLLKDPFVFEFLGIPEHHRPTESDLEDRLIARLEDFLLELGRGFCFVARQKRITVGTDHFYVDLVFYHRILKCFVLVDLKMAPFKPADAGQMNFYLNWFKHEESAPDDNPPIGILLCLDSKELQVKYATEGMQNLVLTGRFALQLPKPQQLQDALTNIIKS